MNTRRSRRPAPVDIHLSQINSSSTCISLQLPMSHRCENCLKDGDIHITHRSKKKAKQRHLSDRRRCEQLWDEKCIQTINCSDAKVAKHNAIRHHLNIKSNAVIESVKLN